MSAPTFHFFTLLTRPDQYDPMRATIAAAGFTEANSRFTVLDNRAGNAHEPYSAINEAVRTAEAPYVVFCHQDLLFDQGHGHDDLVQVLDELERLDPTWAVVGNAGFDGEVGASFALVDGTGEHVFGPLPGRVLTLDENLLVLKRAASPECSPELSGFHLYATDLCLNAYQSGHSAYVVDFRVTHLGTTLDYETLHRLAPAFEAHWGRTAGGACLKSPPGILLLSRFGPLLRRLGIDALLRRSYHKHRLIRLVDRLLRPWRAKWLPRR